MRYVVHTQDPEGPTKLVDPGSGITYPIERVDMTAADGGFMEWKEKFWWAKVYDGKTYGEYVRLATDKAGNKAPDITKVVNQSLYGARPLRVRARRPASRRRLRRRPSHPDHGGSAQTPREWPP